MNFSSVQSAFEMLLHVTPIFQQFVNLIVYVKAKKIKYYMSISKFIKSLKFLPRQPTAAPGNP